MHAGGSPIATAAHSPDEALAACPGVRDCQEILLRRYEERIRACARRMSIDHAKAEDLAQETFVRVLEALPRFEGRSSFKTWLTRIATNTCVDHFRRERTRSAHRTSPRDEELFWDERPSPAPGPFDQVIADGRACHLDQAFAALPLGQRQVAELALTEGLPHAEIAERLGISRDAVKGRLKRARTGLRERLADPVACPLCAALGEFRIRPDGTLE